MVEHFFSCPYCGENISILIDLGVAEQEYIEDCEVCCRPIELSLRSDDGTLTEFNARTGDDS